MTDTHSLVGPEIETVPGIILERARLRGGAPCLHHVRDGTWQTIAWEAYADASLRIASANFNWRPGSGCPTGGRLWEVVVAGSDNRAADENLAVPSQ